MKSRLLLLRLSTCLDLIRTFSTFLLPTSQTEFAWLSTTFCGPLLRLCNLSPLDDELQPKSNTFSTSRDHLIESWCNLKLTLSNIFSCVRITLRTVSNTMHGYFLLNLNTPTKRTTKKTKKSRSEKPKTVKLDIWSSVYPSLFPTPRTSFYNDCFTVKFLLSTFFFSPYQPFCPNFECQNDCFAINFKVPVDSAPDPDKRAWDSKQTLIRCCCNKLKWFIFMC